MPASRWFPRTVVPLLLAVLFVAAAGLTPPGIPRSVAATAGDWECGRAAGRTGRRRRGDDPRLHGHRDPRRSDDFRAWGADGN